MTAIGAVGFAPVAPYLDNIEHSIDTSPFDILIETKSLAVRMMVGVLIALLAIALADFLYQRWEFNKQMRMTKQKVKDEYKQTGVTRSSKENWNNCGWKKPANGWCKTCQRPMLSSPTRPTIPSLAKYDTEVSDAPIVIAKGVDEVAMRIREVATEHNIILFENKPLARSLYDTVEIDQPIPVELYKAVAEVISFVYKKKGKIK